MKKILSFTFLVLLNTPFLVADEPKALNPFAPKPAVREDAQLGTIETSDGKVHEGMIYLTRDMRLKIYDEKTKRQREIPLQVVGRIDAHVKWERMEKEWQFQELAADKKLYSGKEYPAREYTHTVTLKDGRKITGPMSAVVYLRTYPKTTGNRPAASAILNENRVFGPALKVSQTDGKPPVEKRFLLHKRQKGEPGTTLKKLLYIKSVDFGTTVPKSSGEKSTVIDPQVNNVA